MKPTVEEIGSLLALKRHERPEEGYFDDFLREFHQRRREEEAAVSGPAAWMKQASAWFSDLGGSKWAYGLGLGYAAIAAAFLLTPNSDPIQQNTPTNVGLEIRLDESAEIEQLPSLDLRPSTQGMTGEQEF